MHDEAYWKEKRSTPRVPLGIVVRVESDLGSRHYYSKNISSGGVFLLAEDPLAEETRLKLELFLPLVSTPVRADGEVVWIQRQEPSGFAVRFTEITETGRNLVRWVVDRYLGTETSP